MKIKTNIRQNYIDIISYLFIVLFTYAAVSKILEFNSFQIQLGQSPLLSAFAGWVSYGVIIAEIGITILLMRQKLQLLGLYSSFFLMIMFTSYIFIILNFSSFVPCSCGGILEKLGWTEHLIFNSVFILMALVAIILKSKTKFVYGFLTINMISGIGIVTVLFLLSEDIIQHRNNFVRRIPDQVHKVKDINLKFNSYYFAGIINDKIYLGNYTAPLLLTEVDSSFKTKKEIVVAISKMELPFRSLELRVQPDYFFAVDGTIPSLFRGKTGDWKAYTVPINNKPFANPVFLDSISMVYRTHNTEIESILGMTTFDKTKSSLVNPSLLQKQIDGIFDTDGTLIYDKDIKKIIYLYRYRNQFIVTDPKLNLSFRGKTIDTISKAQIKVIFNKDKEERTLAGPALAVNKYAVVQGGLLFVHSGLMGKFEDAKMWKQTSMIDVYDINTNSYIVSFYVYNIEGKKMSRFFISHGNLYALIGSHLVSYKLSNIIRSRFSIKKK